MTVFEKAWQVAKFNFPAKPVGVMDNKKVVMFQGKPYYQSTGTSGTTKKRKGGWYGFAGVEPDMDKWFNDGSRGDWWIKGNAPDISEHAQLGEATEPDEMGNQFYEPGLHGQSIAGHVSDLPESLKWPEINSAKEMNEKLAQEGWEAPIRGQYPEAKPEAKPGDLRWQVQQGGGI